LGPVPDIIDDPAIVMLWGITRESLDSWLKASGDGATDEIRGFAASNGVVEGPARVIKSVEDIGAVVGTGTATSRIKDGQRIRVDGGRGVVTILH
jgi:pyruvate,water dikinase